MKKIKVSDNLILLVVFAVIFLFFTVMSRSFLTYNNIRIVLKHMVLMGILAIGLTPLMISGGIDLSFGSNLSLATVMMALLYDSGTNLLLVLLVGLVITTAIGFFNGFVIEKFNILPILFTLGMMSVLVSVSLVTASFQYKDRGMVAATSQSIAIYTDELYSFANTTFLKIPIPMYVLCVLFIVFFILLKYTVLGRRVYAIGGNKKISMLFGLKVKRIRIILYTMFGVLTGIAAIVSVAITGVGWSYSGANLLLPVISAVVLGGVSLSGGRGTILGTLFGLLIMSVIFNGLTVLQVHSFYIRTFQGLVLILVVTTYEIRRKREYFR
jgi:ribose/xylose/arabinose/galactoside ABC-type transport system permease subunit